MANKMLQRELTSLIADKNKNRKKERQNNSKIERFHYREAKKQWKNLLCRKNIKNT